MARRNDYNVLHVLGKGAFGTVYLVQHKTETEMFAMKTIELQNATDEEREAAEKEAQVMSLLNHDHVVRYETSYFQGRTLSIFTEFCAGGDLEHFLMDTPGSLPEPLILCWMKQTASAIEHLHEKGILHRDLKPANFYLTEKGDIKLGDLGIAKVLEKATDFTRSYVGTPFYMSPEIFARRGYNYKTDIWSFGCIVYELASRVKAFDGANMTFLIMKINEGKVPPIGDQYSAPLRQLVKSMMSKDPDVRPSASDILARCPVKDAPGRPKTPRDLIKETGLKTKWGTHESSRDFSEILTMDSTGSSTSSLFETVIKLPMDSLVLHRKRLSSDKEPQPNIYTNIKANKGGMSKDKVGVKDPEATIRKSQEIPRPFEAWTTMTETLKSLSSMASSDSGAYDSDTGRKGDSLVARQIEDLRSQCVSGLGADLMSKTTSLMESYTDVTLLTASLTDLMGEEMFYRYGEPLMFLTLYESGKHFEG